MNRYGTVTVSQGWTSGMWRQETARKRLKQLVQKKKKVEAAYIQVGSWIKAEAA